MDPSDFSESPEDELPDDSEFAPEPPAPAASTPASPPSSGASGPIASPSAPQRPSPPAPQPSHPASARYVPPASARVSDPRRREPPGRPPETAPREPLRAIDVRSRALTVNGEEWIASEAGRTASGGAGDSRASLLLVLFARSADPEQPVREALTTVPDLDHLGDEDLAALLARARPFKIVQERSEVFPDTRKKGQKGS